MAKEFLIERHLGCMRPLATLTLGARASRLGLVQRVDGGLSCSRLPRVHHRPRVRWSSARGHLIAKKELGVSCPPGLGSQVPDLQKAGMRRAALRDSANFSSALSQATTDTSSKATGENRWHAVSSASWWSLALPAMLCDQLPSTSWGSGNVTRRQTCSCVQWRAVNTQGGQFSLMSDRIVET